MIKLDLNKASGNVVIGNISEGDNTSISSSIILDSEIRRQIEDKATSKGISKKEMENFFNQWKNQKDDKSILNLVKNNYPWVIDILKKII